MNRTAHARAIAWRWLLIGAAFAPPLHLLAAEVSFPPDRMSAVRGFLELQCLKCHAADAESGVRLDDMPLRIDSVAAAERWQRVLAVLNAGSMPPAGEPKPPATAKTEFLAVLSETLVAARRTLGDQGRVAALRRLNRREYANTLRELFGIDVDVSALPADQQGGGFDTFGASLFMSSDQFEQYLRVGRRAAAEAIDRWRRSAEPSPPRETVRTEVEIAARRQMASLLNGYFLGGYRQGKLWQAAGADPARTKEFGFPDEHEARFRIRAYEEAGPFLGQYLALPKSDDGAWLTYVDSNLHHTETITIPPTAPPGRYLLRLRVGGNGSVPVSRRFLEMGIVSSDDFQRLGVFQVTGSPWAPQQLEVPVTITENGPRAFSFREKQQANQTGTRLYARIATVTNGVGPDLALWIDWVEWEGPIPDPKQSDRLAGLFGAAFPSSPDTADARRTLAHAAARAFRGVTPDNDYLDRLMAVYEEQRAAGKGFAEALVEPFAVILASPAFLYLADPAMAAAVSSDAPDPAPADRLLSGLELASRLSYFLWTAPPDDALLAAAAAGRLRDPGELSRQATRMLADPRAFECGKGFTHQWLGVDRLDFFRFDPQLYPDFDEATRDAAKEEIYRTFHLLLTENLDARSLLKSDFVVVNGLLAEYYGLVDASDPDKPKPITGDAFRKVSLPAGSPRGGLLGMAAILGMGSNGERTSPVERGAWVLRKLLHAPPPPAPPDVPQLSRLDGKKISTRERLRMHQEEPQCAQCHRVIDPIGFGLENFDAAGKWRTEEHSYQTGWVLEIGEKKVHGKVATASFPIDPAGAFHNGPSFKDYFELRDRIAERGDDFLRGLIENLFAYALGRPVSFADAETIDGLVAKAKAEGARLASIIESIVACPEFQTK